ncbi:hypothetical protein B0H19DRAFT_1059907 [Mycena capillaripes]|nr:hypothetical protein B0H19DRAFT_1059907 [Mycena capillaripes]
MYSKPVSTGLALPMLWRIGENEKFVGVYQPVRGRLAIRAQSLDMRWEDVALLILSVCDIETVLSMGRVNTFFHQLSLRKQLWILLVEDLAAHLIIDLPRARSLAEHSADELIGLVKRAVVGPAMWSSRHTSPTLVDQISLPVSLLSAHRFELLPGGQYLLAQWTYWPRWIELWNVGANKPFKLWSRDCYLHAQFGVEMLDGGRSIVIFIPEALAALNVIQINLKTGASQDLLDISLPNKCRIVSWSRPAICGDLLAYPLLWANWNKPRAHDATPIPLLLLLNWQLQEYIFFHYPSYGDSVASPFALAPGHLIFTIPPGIVIVHAVATLTTCWRSISTMSLEHIVDVPPNDTIDPAILAVIQFPSSGAAPQMKDSILKCKLATPVLALHRSPLRRDGYKLLVYQQEHVDFEEDEDADEDGGNDQDASEDMPAPAAVLQSYRFAIAPDTGTMEQWVRTSSLPAALSVPPLAPISYAGYSPLVSEMLQNSIKIGSLKLSLLTEQLHPNPDSDPRAGHTNWLPEVSVDGDDRIALSPYSHALVHPLDSMMVVSYYV